MATRDDGHSPAPLSPRAVRETLAESGHRARKRFGQHFLSNRHVAERIVRTADLHGSEAVVEIGPGLGALTDALADGAGRLWLVEIDRDLAQRARERYAERPAVRVVEADALSADFVAMLGDAAPAVLVANLPYNVATAILMRLVEPPVAFRRMVVMVQLEVALRLAAPPGSKTYGLLSVMAQTAARTQVAFRVPPSAFVPRPKVESAVVLVEPLAAPPVPIDDRAVFRRVVRAAFGQRRKHLANSLRNAYADAATILAAAQIDPTRRPETLSLAEFALLSNLIGAREAASL